MDITTIGFDLAKTVFQVHGADGEGRAVLRRTLRRGKVLAFFAGLPSCLVGMEACASAHYWARELQALGHEVRLIPPQYVRPFVKTCPSSKQMGLLSVFHKGGSGSSLFDVKPLGVDGSSDGFGWSVF